MISPVSLRLLHSMHSQDPYAVNPFAVSPTSNRKTVCSSDIDYRGALDTSMAIVIPLPGHVGTEDSWML